MRTRAPVEFNPESADARRKASGEGSEGARRAPIHDRRLAHALVVRLGLEVSIPVEVASNRFTDGGKKCTETWYASEWIGIGVCRPSSHHE